MFMLISVMQIHVNINETSGSGISIAANSIGDVSITLVDGITNIVTGERSGDDGEGIITLQNDGNIPINAQFSYSAIAPYNAVGQVKIY